LLYYPLGHTIGVTKSGVTSTHFPNPSLTYPFPHITGIDYLTQYPKPSGRKSDGQCGVFGTGAGVGASSY
jgi:hypothetical protein